MNFDFEPQQYEFQAAFKRFLAKSRPADRLAALSQSAEADVKFWQELTELGLYGILVPEKYGGLGLSIVDLALVLEELSASLISSPVVETLLAADLLSRFGSAAQQLRYLPQIAAGRLRATVGATEVDAGLNPAAMTTTIAQSGGRLRLNGQKVLVPNAAAADLFLVTARREPQNDIALVLLEAGRPGITASEHETLDLTSRFHKLQLNEVSIEPADLVGAEASVGAAERLFDVGATFAALQMMGIAARTLEIAVAFARSREQFGRPIGAFQAIKHRLADMAVRTDTGRTAAYYASWAVSEDAPERLRAAAIAKSFCGDAARFVCNEAIQIHGGMGFTWELGLHLYLRRIKILECSWGDAAMHRERLLVDALRSLPSPNETEPLHVPTAAAAHGRPR